MKRNIQGYAGFRKNSSGFRMYGKAGVAVRSNIFSIVSLSHGAGCTHMAISLANYISRINQSEKTALIIKPEDLESDFIKNHVIKRVDVLVNGDKAADDYRFRVYDIGVVYTSGQAATELADTVSDSVGQRIVMCNDNEDFYYFLDKYTRLSQKTGNYVYLFNRVPPSRAGRIGDIMSDYIYNFVPVYSIDSLEEVAGLFELFAGR